jgi:hypothetical protein
MKRALAILTLLFVVFAATAQSENSIIIDQNSFRPVQTDVLTGANVDPISVDSSRRPCARIKVKINRMTPEDINKIDVKIITNNQLTKCKTADYENGLILELTAKQPLVSTSTIPSLASLTKLSSTSTPRKSTTWRRA